MNEQMKIFWNAIPKDYIDDATKELLEAIHSISEFYVSRGNYKSELSPFTVRDCESWGWLDPEMDIYDTVYGDD